MLNPSITLSNPSITLSILYSSIAGGGLSGAFVSVIATWGCKIRVFNLVLFLHIRSAIFMIRVPEPLAMPLHTLENH